MSENIETQQVQDDEISLLDLLQTVVDNLRLIVFGSLGAGVLALGVSYSIPPTYTAKTQFLNEVATVDVVFIVTCGLVVIHGIFHHTTL